MASKNPNYPNLLFSKEARDTLSTDKRILRDAKLARKLFNGLDDLNDHGTDNNYHGSGNVKPLGDGWWELRIRYKNDFWRILFRKVDSKHYGIVLVYLKKSNQIPQTVWNKAIGIAKREGWL